MSKANGDHPTVRSDGAQSTGYSELDHVAGTRRDAGRLAEPLEDSVLQYSLRKLKPNVNVDDGSPTAQELENAMNSEPIAEVLQDGMQPMSFSSARQSISPVAPVYSRTLADDLAMLAAQSADVNQQPMNFLWADGTNDWWQLGWDESGQAQAGLPFGDFFGMTDAM